MAARLLLRGQALCLVLLCACRRQTAQKFVRALLRLYECSACTCVWMLGAAVSRALLRDLVSRDASALKHARVTPREFWSQSCLHAQFDRFTDRKLRFANRLTITNADVEVDNTRVQWSYIAG